MTPTVYWTGWALGAVVFLVAQYFIVKWAVLAAILEAGR